jgi:hypothetical protein
MKPSVMPKKDGFKTIMALKKNQVDTSLSKKVYGLGMGIPLAKMLVELHDGTLNIYSTPKKRDPSHHPTTDQKCNQKPLMNFME